MKILFLTALFLSSFSVFASKDKITVAISSAIEHEYIKLSKFSLSRVGVLTTIGNTTMAIQRPLKYVFGDRIRDFEATYKVSFNVEDERFVCLASVKAKSKSSRTYKVLVSHCGQASEIKMFTSGPDNGPQIIKKVIFVGGIVMDVFDLRASEY